MPIRLRRPKQLHPWLKKEELALGDTYTHTQKKSVFVSKLDTRPPQHFSLSTGRLDSISLLIQWNSGLIFWLSWHHPASLRSICLLSLSLTSHWKLETCRGRNWLCGFLVFFWALKWKGNGILALSCNFVFLLRFYWQFVIVFIRLKREGAFNIHFQFLWPKFYLKWCLYFGLKKKKNLHVKQKLWTCPRLVCIMDHFSSWSESICPLFFFSSRNWTNFCMLTHVLRREVPSG